MFYFNLVKYEEKNIKLIVGFRAAAIIETWGRARAPLHGLTNDFGYTTETSVYYVRVYGRIGSLYILCTRRDSYSRMYV